VSLHLTDPLLQFRGWPPAVSSSGLVDQVLSALRVVFVPDSFASIEAARRYAHEDLPRLSERQLWQELERARFLLAWLDDPDPWLSERFKAVEAEQRRRKAAR